MLPPNDPQRARGVSEAMAAKRPPRRFSPHGSAVAAAAVAEPVPIVKGTLIGDYRVERRLDEGGMGTVYAAVHPIIDKRVAIKVLHPHVARQEEAVARFIQEARAVNAIGHPGIVDIFGFGRFIDGRHYITMEYLTGQQLLAFLNETGPLSPVEMLPVARQLTESLAAAHDKGVVHRDMKPENVFLSVTAGNYKDHPWPPRTKILDFGLAKLIEVEFEDATPRTRAGVTVGTPYYMSPEQCRGKAVDRRADIYAVGVMMYEMITGRVPFYAPESVDVLYMHLTQAPEPPSRHRSVPPPVEELILRCMAKNAEERPTSMHELMAELDRIYKQLSPDAAIRERPEEELRAEASAFFGGVEEVDPGPEPEPGASARTTVPRLPQDLQEAVEGKIQELAGDGVEPSQAVADSGDFDAAPTPIKVMPVVRRPAAAAPRSPAPERPRPPAPRVDQASPGVAVSVPSLPDEQLPVSSVRGSAVRPSLPTPAPVNAPMVAPARTPPGAAPTRTPPGAAPTRTPPGAAPAEAPTPTAVPKLAPTPVPGLTEAALPSLAPRINELPSARREAPVDRTDPVVRLAPYRDDDPEVTAEVRRPGAPRLGTPMLWAVVALQSVVILLLLLVLLFRK